MDAHVLLGCYRQLEQRITEIGGPSLVSLAMPPDITVPKAYALVQRAPKTVEELVREQELKCAAILGRALVKPNKNERKRLAADSESSSPPPAKKVKKAVTEEHLCNCLPSIFMEEVWQKQVGLPLPVVISEWTEEGGVNDMLTELRDQTLYAVAVQDTDSCCRSNR